MYTLDFPIKTCNCKGFSFAMFGYRMVTLSPTPCHTRKMHRDIHRWAPAIPRDWSVLSHYHAKSHPAPRPNDAVGEVLGMVGPNQGRKRQKRCPELSFAKRFTSQKSLHVIFFIYVILYDIVILYYFILYYFIYIYVDYLIIYHIQLQTLLLTIFTLFI